MPTPSLVSSHLWTWASAFPRYRPRVRRGGAKPRNVLETRIGLHAFSVFSSDFDEGAGPCPRAVSAGDTGCKEAAWRRLTRVVGSRSQRTACIHAGTVFSPQACSAETVPQTNVAGDPDRIGEPRGVQGPRREGTPSACAGSEPAAGLEQPRPRVGLACVSPWEAGSRRRGRVLGVWVKAKEGEMSSSG